MRFSTRFEERRGYTDSPPVNSYVEPFNADENYPNLTECSLYYDGKSWHYNLDEE